ncbi:hypothetical protein QF027_002540 [Streptomyces canus]|nr:hypothetical protein [Streptomyces canus]
MRLDSIGQTTSLNHSSVGRSSATPRRATMGAWVWQLTSPGRAICPRPSMRSAAGSSSACALLITDSMTPSRTTIAASCTNPTCS